MRTSSRTFGVGSVMVAAALAAGLTTAGNIGWLAVGVGGCLFWVAGAVQRSRENHRRRKRDFKAEFSPAVGEFLQTLGSALEEYGSGTTDGEETLIKMAERAEVPDPNNCSDVSGVDADLLQNFLDTHVYGGELTGDARRRLRESRQTMVKFYQDWSADLQGVSRPLTGPLDEWLDDLKDNHATIFKLWMYVECALVESRRSLSPADFSPYEPLIEKWLDNE